jgi:hypothetical protein
VQAFKALDHRALLDPIAYEPPEPSVLTAAVRR